MINNLSDFSFLFRSLKHNKICTYKHSMIYTIHSRTECMNHHHRYMWYNFPNGFSIGICVAVLCFSYFLPTTIYFPADYMRMIWPAKNVSQSENFTTSRLKLIDVNIMPYYMPSFILEKFGKQSR